MHVAPDRLGGTGTRLRQLVSACLRDDPAQRPDLLHLRDAIRLRRAAHGRSARERRNERNNLFQDPATVSVRQRSAQRLQQVNPSSPFIFLFYFFIFLRVCIFQAAALRECLLTVRMGGC